MNTRYKIWKRIKQVADQGMRDNYFKPRTSGVMRFNHCCPRCNQWEHQGNAITTTCNDDQSDHRICSNCEYEWDAIFTPFGFIPVSEFKKEASETLSDGL